MAEVKKRGRDTFAKIEPVLNLMIQCFRILPLKFRKVMFNSCRMINGNIGLGIRYSLFKSISKTCGSNVAIHPCVSFFDIEEINVGDNVTFHPYCYIDGSGGIFIGDNVSIAHGVTIMSSSHNNNDIEVPIPDQGMNFKSTTVENNVWIGAKATILYGCRIGTGSIVGANSLITKDIESYKVVGGIPAKVIKNRLL